jgi:hypothetical protein
MEELVQKLFPAPPVPLAGFLGHNANTALPRNHRPGTGVPAQPKGQGFRWFGPPSTREFPNMSNQNQKPGQQNQNPGQKPGQQQQGGGQKPGQQQQDPSRRQGEKPMQNPAQDR